MKENLKQTATYYNPEGKQTNIKNSRSPPPIHIFNLNILVILTLIIYLIFFQFSVQRSLRLRYDLILVRSPTCKCTYFCIVFPMDK